MAWEVFVSTNFGPNLILNSQLTDNNDLFFNLFLVLSAVISYAIGNLRSAGRLAKPVLRGRSLTCGALLGTAAAIGLNCFVGLGVLHLEVVRYNADGMYPSVPAWLLVALWAGLFCWLGHKIPAPALRRALRAAAAEIRKDWTR